MRARSLLVAAFAALAPRVDAQVRSVSPGIGDIDSVVFIRLVNPLPRGEFKSRRIPMTKIWTAKRSPANVGGFAAIAEHANRVGFVALSEGLPAGSAWCTKPPSPTNPRTSISLYWAGGQKTVNRPDFCSDDPDPSSDYARYHEFMDQVEAVVGAPRARRTTAR